MRSIEGTYTNAPLHAPSTALCHFPKPGSSHGVDKDHTCSWPNARDQFRLPLCCSWPFFFLYPAQILLSSHVRRSVQSTVEKRSERYQHCHGLLSKVSTYDQIYDIKNSGLPQLLALSLLWVMPCCPCGTSIFSARLSLPVG